MIIGIDLGTTNSLVTIWEDGEATLIPNALGSYLTPSCVSIDDNDNILTGLSARERLLSHPDSTIACFKRFMGTDRNFKIGKKIFRAEELSSLILRSLKADAEAYLGQSISEAIITVPAYFNDMQRKATKAAGELAGFKVERLLNEPTAAALAYGLHQFSEDCKILVVDLGGGTFDVSILDKFEGVMEVRAIAGDNFLGGEDFVDIIMDHFIETAGKDLGIPSRLKNHLIHALLRRQAEIVKRALTQSDAANIEIPWNDKPFNWVITKETFEKISLPLIQRIRLPIERALRDANIHPDEIDHIVLAGGATRMPFVKRLIATLFRKLPTVNINPDEVVARGAAVQAGLKVRDKALQEVVFTDVAPFSLGIAASEFLDEKESIHGLFSPIIERSSVIPVSKSAPFCTVYNHQSSIDIDVYQGESRLVADNILLGKLNIPVPRDKAGKQSIEVRFTYDINSLLEVEVTVLSTGIKKRLVIEGNPGVLSTDEIEKRLTKLNHLKIHPKDQEENRYLLTRGERLYQENLGAVREKIGKQIALFSYILNCQDLKEIAEARKVFTTFLESIDRHFFE